MRIAGVELLGHQARKGIDLDGVDDRRRGALCAGAFQCRLCLVALRFERRDPLAQNVVEFGDPVLDRAVQTPQPIFALGELILERDNPAIDPSLLAAWPSASIRSRAASRSGVRSRCFKPFTTIPSKTVDRMWRPLQTLLPFCWQPPQL
jgi:hypothetical protein